MKKALLIFGILTIPFYIYSQNDIIGQYSNPLMNYNFESAVLNAYLTAQLVKSQNLDRSYTDDARERAKYAEKREAYKVVDLMYVILDCYDRQKKYPDTISDGWHNVVAMNYSNICREAKVYVLNNHVTSYIINNWDKKEIRTGSPISRCKSTIELVNDKTDKNKKFERKLDLYFIDYLIAPDAAATPPKVDGRASFWAHPDIDGGTVIIYVNQVYKGELSLMDESIPKCGQKGTLTFEEANGTYDFRAYNDKNVWRGTIVIYPGECTLQILSESNTTVEGYK